MQPQKNNPLFKVDDIEVELEMKGGLIFLHLPVFKPSVSSFKKLKYLVLSILEELNNRGTSILFFTTTNPAIVRLGNMVKPCFEVVPLENQGWLGSWLTFEEVT
jgi:hypothetical protein